MIYIYIKVQNLFLWRITIFFTKWIPFINWNESDICGSYILTSKHALDGPHIEIIKLFIMTVDT